MQASLQFLGGTLAGKDIPVEGEEVRIGRLPEMDVILEDEVVSRHQATLRLDRGQLVLVDEGSTNGTFVNDRKVERQVLHDGDTVEFGLGGPTARFRVDDSVVSEASVVKGATSGTESTEPAAGRGEFYCPGCHTAYPITVREITEGGSRFLEIETTALPPFCPRCGAAVGRPGDTDA